MKLTESRIKEIIREEVERLNEQDPVDTTEKPPENAEQKPEDQTKTIQQLRTFLLNLSKQVTQIKGADAAEVKAIADLIVKMLKAMPQGQVARHIKYADDQLTKKLGESNER